ncbi:MAG: hypothetical protein K0U12_03000 [Gammaproteobacteria bacterium]|nr:hypothetical protein [Gammaproteobacteria bacterium]
MRRFQALPGQDEPSKYHFYQVACAVEAWPAIIKYVQSQVEGKVPQIRFWQEEHVIQEQNTWQVEIMTSQNICVDYGDAILHWQFFAGQTEANMTLKTAVDRQWDFSGLEAEILGYHGVSNHLKLSAEDSAVTFNNLPILALKAHYEYRCSQDLLNSRITKSDADIQQGYQNKLSQDVLSIRQEITQDLTERMRTFQAELKSLSNTESFYYKAAKLFSTQQSWQARIARKTQKVNAVKALQQTVQNSFSVQSIQDLEQRLSKNSPQALVSGNFFTLFGRKGVAKTFAQAEQAALEYQNRLAAPAA